MLTAKNFKCALFTIACALGLVCLPAQSAYPLQGIDGELGIGSAKNIKEGSISDIAREDLLRRLKNTLNSNSMTKIDREYIDMEGGFDAFPQDKTIDLMLRDVDVPSILRIIAKEGGMNIVVDKSVMGVITAELKGISLNDAMQIVLTSEELEHRISGKTIFVASRPVMAKKGLNRKYIKTFKLNNSDPVYIADILNASIFNKGYKVNESAPGASALQLTPAAEGSEKTAVEAGSSTGQSSLISSKTIKGKVEKLKPSENFGDASKLASEIKIQHSYASTGDIKVDNNDGGAIVIPDTRTNSVLVAGLQKDIMLAEEAIKYLDKPLKQVAIEVSLIELTKDDTKNLGLNATMQQGKTSGGFNAVANEFANVFDFASAADQTGISFSSISDLKKEVAFKLKALVKTEQAKLLANPKIIALDGSESLIKITEQVVSSVETTIVNDMVTYNAELADVGIVLNILPKIGNNDYITMRIRPSITSPLPEVTIGEVAGGKAAIRVTPISTREVILQDVRVKSGETLAIAGLMKDREVTGQGKVPLLGDMPLIGKLFSDTEKGHQKTELIILITPVIIDDVAMRL